jgi:hypothetical protein
MVATPNAVGVSKVAASPLWSLVTEHDDPPQVESCTPLLALHPMVAPLTGVTPSDVTTRTIIGLAACVPTGVEGLSPLSRTIVSLAAAPYVSTFVMVEDPPLAGSLSVMF